MIKEIPMLFSTPMVQATLEDRKTNTRRILNPQPSDSWMEGVRRNFPDMNMFDSRGKQLFWINDPTKSNDQDVGEIKPKAKPGDLIWVRETWCHTENPEGDIFGKYLYKSMGDQPHGRWRPSIHMPKAAARIWLRVTDVGVEGLNDISEADAIAEGWPGKVCVLDDPDCNCAGHDPILWYVNLWESINGAGSWVVNPWVWVYSFEVLSTTGSPADL